LNQNIQEAPRYNLAPRAILCVLLFLVPALAGWLAIEIAALVGAVSMVLTRCLTMDQASKALDLKTILLIGGMSSLGIAMEESGAAAEVAVSLVGWLEAWGPMAVLAGVFLITSLACSVMPAAAVVLLMAPIALRTAVDLNLSPHSVMMVMAMAAAGSFNSPVAHPANMLIMGPGGYRFVDYLRVGIPLSLVVLVVVLLVMPWFWPIQLQ
jgi:di/tricarboxylate transporter